MDGDILFGTKKNVKENTILNVLKLDYYIILNVEMVTLTILTNVKLNVLKDLKTV